MLYWGEKILCSGPFVGIPTDEDQATGMEKIVMRAMKEGSVRIKNSFSTLLIAALKMKKSELM